MRSLLAALLIPCTAAAQAPPTVWTGLYSCGQGVTALTLTVRPTGQGNAAEALFHFTADKSNPGVPEGCFAMAGTYDARHIRLHATDWLLQPPGYVSVDLSATIGTTGRTASGAVTGPGCDVLALTLSKNDPGVARCHAPTS